MRIDQLVIEPDREEHLARHHVTIAEAEEVVFANPFSQRTREDRYLLVGQTAGGRYLSVVVAPRQPGVYGLVTARDATERERRADRRARGRR